MRHIIKRIALLSAALMVAALPALADEVRDKAMMEPDQNSDRVECLLVAMNGCDRVGSTESRIDRITNEINKGSAVYTQEELKILNNQLDQAREELLVEYGGGA